MNKVMNNNGNSNMEVNNNRNYISTDANTSTTTASTSGSGLSYADKLSLLSSMMEDFETLEIKNYFKDMVATIPDYIFTMPASTTGKYHNKQQCQKYGQLIHIFMFNSILNHLLKISMYRSSISKVERDLLRCVPLFHDAFKCGKLEDYKNKTTKVYSVHEHPKLAGEWVRKTKVQHDIPPQLKETLARLCERHSGEWTTSKYSSVVLDEPVTSLEKLVHICDYLSSRVDLTYELPPELLRLLDRSRNTNFITQQPSFEADFSSNNNNNNNTLSPEEVDNFLKKAKYCCNNAGTVMPGGNYRFHLKVATTVVNTKKVSVKQAKYIDELYKIIMGN